MLKKITLHSLLKYYSPVILLLLAIATRCAVMGNPFIDVDETFYLFTGGRLLHGDLPYVDIWDRKPIGIFLIYALFHLLGAWSLWAYQIGALLCVWATALLIVRTARLIASQQGALIAGILYIVWVVFGHGEGGQTPVFYNALVTAAMMLFAYRLPTIWAHHEGRRTGIWIMVLFGLAMQIKYTAVFEGVYAGLVLLWSSYKARRTWATITLDACLWVFSALVPTLVVFLFYAGIGHAHDWWFANIQSIFLRSLPATWHRTLWMLIVGVLLTIAIPLRFILKIPLAPHRKSQYIFLAGWALSSLLGVIVFGGYLRHYFLPLFAPFFIVSAPLWHRKIGKLWLIGLLIFAAIKDYSIERKVALRDRGHAFKALSQALSSPPGCVFDYNGPTIVLDIAPYCPLTSYPFPVHLRINYEKDALGLNPVQETQRILALKPLYIVANNHGGQPDTNHETDHLVYSILKRDYSPIYQQFVDQNDEDPIVIYKLKAQETALPVPTP